MARSTHFVYLRALKNRQFWVGRIADGEGRKLAHSRWMGRGLEAIQESRQGGRTFSRGSTLLRESRF